MYLIPLVRNMEEVGIYSRGSCPGSGNGNVQKNMGLGDQVSRSDQQRECQGHNDTEFPTCGRNAQGRCPVWHQSLEN